MDHSKMLEPNGCDRLLELAAGGDREAWGSLFTRHHDRLRRMVALRVDQRLRGRIDPSDVIQDVYLEAWRRLPEYLERPALPFFLWLRLTTGQMLHALHRHHLGAEMRDPAREISLDQHGLPGASSAALAAHLLGHDTAPSDAAIRAERKLHLQGALNEMDEADRDVLLLRHFEQLTNAETARVLDITEAAASKRYVRALERLHEILLTLPGGRGAF
jgi:RNA polymerase sigma-70 factor (ECF subfamily)